MFADHPKYVRWKKYTAPASVAPASSYIAPTNARIPSPLMEQDSPKYALASSVPKTSVSSVHTVVPGLRANMYAEPANTVPSICALR